MHVPVLLKEVLESFKNCKNQEGLAYLDGTFGRGGHAQAVLQNFNIETALFMDQDLAAIESANLLLKNNTKLKVRFLVGSSSLLLLVIGVTTYFATYSDLILEFNDDPDYVESSVKDNKVIINEVESDYYYYKSLNYTSNDGTLPTTDNKDIYNDNKILYGVSNC